VLDPKVSVSCPARGRSSPRPYSVRYLEDLYDRRPDEFRALADSLAGDYAYSLGYREAGMHHGLCCDDRRPILADGPPAPPFQGNSPNHGGAGQNVLYVGGEVQWHTRRTVGPNGDDLYLNRDNQVLAGVDRDDTVLGRSGASPVPQQ
jgi:hypothetical protein